MYFPTILGSLAVIVLLVGLLTRRKISRRIEISSRVMASILFICAIILLLK
ncbi:hypothetical protein [Gottfriedia acidiceleris]|uniref:hypothetical protein n=1 Tax=Gottfriedia acidiceleris TaxID=371036 RepID=UPI002FFF9C4A